MLRVEGLNGFYGRSHVVFDAALTVGSGEVVALLGRNGAGKTTLMQSIVGFLRSRTTRLEVDAVAIDRTRPYQRVRKGLGYVPQGGRIFGGLTVRENLEIVRGRNVQQGWTPEKAFDLFPALRDIATRDAGLLSGGERQMVAVARALMANPSVILLDEPSEGLAPVIVRKLAELAGQLKEEGIGVLLAEQNHRFALGAADRGYLMEKGRICLEAPAADLVDSAALKRYLGV